ncbi:MAG: toll/interleukin-1 receptor domain-containing protein, partial [Psychrosphaera sp.]|nr:toll/interleukin-1 receptor domain-containing protein [Psychrosphaera sp.]
FHQLKFDEMIPCNCPECKTNATPWFYEYKMLRKYQEKGRVAAICGLSTDDVPVQKLIGDVLFEPSVHGRTKHDFTHSFDRTEEPAKKDIEQGLKVFISYSSKDMALKDDLLTALSPLKRKWKLDCWTDSQITAGVDWEKSLMGELAEADLILLLISPDFIASEYCFVKELDVALERHKRGEAKVIPIILRKCLWNDLPFSSLQGLPERGLPVTKWGDPDDAFFSIAKGIEKALEGHKSLGHFGKS